jgi:hypothetical protein
MFVMHSCVRRIVLTLTFLFLRTVKNRVTSNLPPPPRQLRYGRLVVMGWDWRLRTVASRACCSSPGDCDVDHVRWYRLGLTPNLSTRAPWQPPVPYGGTASRDICGASRIMGEGNENLVYPSPWDFKRSLTCRKISHGLPALLPTRRKVCCGFLSLLKSIVLAGFEPASGKYTNHYTTKATICCMSLMTALLHLSHTSGALQRWWDDWHWKLQSSD